MAKKRKNWIQKAVKKPGGLRRSAKRLGIIKGDEKLTASKLAALERHARKTGNKLLLRRVLLAKAFMKMRRKAKKKRS